MGSIRTACYMVVATVAGGNCDDCLDMMGFTFLLVLFYDDSSRLLMGSFSEHGPPTAGEKGEFPGVHRKLA